MELLTTEKKLYDHLAEREKNILKILVMKANEYKKEDYHCLRVEIKKLKALLELVNYCYKDFPKKKYFKPFIKVSKQSGKIRKLQHEESILEKYDITKIEKYLIRVKEDIKRNEKKFQFLIQKKHKRKIKKTFKKMTPYLKELPSHKINDFIKKVEKKINKIILQNSLKPENLHELRKILKNDLYNKKSLNLGDRKELEAVNNFQELLGKWHDSRTLNNLLEKSIIKGNIDHETLNQLVQINEETRANTRNLNEEINKTLEFNFLFV